MTCEECHKKDDVIWNLRYKIERLEKEIDNLRLSLKCASVRELNAIKRRYREAGADGPGKLTKSQD